MCGFTEISWLDSNNRNIKFHQLMSEYWTDSFDGMFSGTISGESRITIQSCDTAHIDNSTWNESFLLNKNVDFSSDVCLFAEHPNVYELNFYSLQFFFISGRIVNVSSVAGLYGYPGLSTYCATKHAIAICGTISGESRITV